jgi:oligopeptide transport system permease protein
MNKPVGEPASSSASAVIPVPIPADSGWSRFKRNRAALLSAYALGLVLLLVAAWPLTLRMAARCGATGADFAQRYAPDHLSDEQFRPPSSRHWFGTDVHGRELFARVLSGAQISLFVGLAGTSMSLVIGVLWGAVAGYAGRRVDDWMMRIVDVLYSLPSIIFVIVLITTLEGLLKQGLESIGAAGLERAARLWFLVLGLSAVSWLNMARIVRGQVLSLRRQGFVEASRALGAHPVRILFRHILPHTAGVVIAYLCLTVPGIILYESFLSYLGLGIQPPMASWGSLLAEGANQINPIRIYWWLIIFPGAFLVTTLLALNFVGDGLRGAWEVPRPD